MSAPAPDPLLVPIEDVDEDFTERTPLLHRTKSKEKGVTPLPKVQLGIVCLIRIVEPICFQVIFPFINQMLLEVGAAKSEDEVGYAAGVVESVFSVAQLLTVFHWGTLSDRIGRKPVLILGCIGSSISAVAFGFSNSFWTLVITRSLNGMMNGNVAVLKSVIGEISDSTNESRAFSFFPMCLNIGILVASFIGGTFGSSKSFPTLTSTFPIFKTYPYLLPNFLAALLPLLVAIIAAIWLEETLPPKSSPSDASSEGTLTASEDGIGPIDNERLDKEETSLKALFTPHINAIMFSFAVLSLLGGAQTALQPLFAFTPVRDGGLGFGEKEIGIAMSIRSVATIAVQLLAFPALQRTFGTNRLFRWLMVLWLPTYLGLPFLNAIARTGDHTALVWVGLSATLLCSAVANMAFVCNLLMTNAAAPSRQLLGAINGYSQVLSSAVRIVGPGGASVLYAVSVSKHIWGGNLIWVVIGIVATIGVISGCLIREAPRLI